MSSNEKVYDFSHAAEPGDGKWKWGPDDEHGTHEQVFKNGKPRYKKLEMGVRGENIGDNGEEADDN